MNHDPTEAVAMRTGEEQNLTWLAVVREVGWVEQGSRYELTKVAGTRGAKILSGQLRPCPSAGARESAGFALCLLGYYEELGRN